MIFSRPYLSKDRAYVTVNWFVYFTCDERRYRPTSPKIDSGNSSTPGCARNLLNRDQNEIDMRQRRDVSTLPDEMPRPKPYWFNAMLSGRSL